MNSLRTAAAALIALLSAVSAHSAIPRYSANPDDFVSARLEHFWVNGEPFRFVGYNVRGMVHYGGGDILGWSTAEHRTQNLDYMQNVGARVARVFVSCKFVNRFVTAERLEATLAAAAARNVYVIVAFTDEYNSGFSPLGDSVYYNYESWNLLNQQWYWSEYAKYYLPQVLHLVNRFKDDPTVFAWQIGNELKCPWNWPDIIPFSHDVATRIRAIDTRHMVSHGTAGRNFFGLNWDQAVQLYRDFDFVTIHPYDGNENLNDAGLAQYLGKPLLVSEAGFSSDLYDYVQRPTATNADIAKWIGRGARGYMNWGLMATDYDMGDGDFLYGIDPVIQWKNHHLDFTAYTQLFTNWAATLANTTPPAPETPSGVQASDGAWVDRVQVTWNPAFAADEYAVFRAQVQERGDAQPSATSINLLTQALGYSECGHYNEASRGEFIYDAKTSTKWCCAHNGLSTPGDHSIVFDLGTTCTINSYVVKHASTGGETPAYNTKTFYIDSSDSMSGPWTTEFAMNNATTVSSNTLTYSTPRTLRYIRLRVTKPNPSTDWAVRIPEFEIWGTTGTDVPVQISGWQTGMSFTDLNVVPGQVYSYLVKARNAGGESLASQSDEGFASAAPEISVAQAKALADGSTVYVTGAVVSAAFTGEFYMQQPDRAAGIRVKWSGAVDEGDQVRVLGTLVTGADGSRRIEASSVSSGAL